MPHQPVDSRFQYGHVDYAKAKRKAQQRAYAKKNAISEALKATVKGTWYEDLPRPKKPPGVAVE